MAWTGSVVNRTDFNGIVAVTVSYTNGTTTFQETYKSHNPSATWIPDTVRNRIDKLVVVDSYTINNGPVTPSSPTVDDPVRALFRTRCRALEICKVLIDLGAIQATDAKVVTLINWIKANANTYLDALG